jgi:hypothetical protein
MLLVLISIRRYVIEIYRPRQKQLKQNVQKAVPEHGSYYGRRMIIGVLWLAKTESD